jgi:hypothetical protein
MYGYGSTEDSRYVYLMLDAVIAVFYVSHHDLKPYSFNPIAFKHVLKMMVCQLHELGQTCTH